MQSVTYVFSGSHGYQIHVNSHMMAIKYEIKHLKQYALDRFTDSFAHIEDKATYFEIVNYVYDFPYDLTYGLRSVVVSATISSIDQILDDADAGVRLNRTTSQHPDFQKDLLRIMNIEKTRTIIRELPFSCDKCGPETVLPATGRSLQLDPRPKCKTMFVGI
jgi:hypothetical protein